MQVHEIEIKAIYQKQHFNACTKQLHGYTFHFHALEMLLSKYFFIDRQIFKDEAYFIWHI